MRKRQYKGENLSGMTVEQQLAREIKRHRQAYGMSQATLARLAGTTQSAIAAIEAGRANPTLKTIASIAAVFQQRPSLHFSRPAK